MAALVEMVVAAAALVAGADRGDAGDGGAGDRRGRARADERAAALDTMNSTKTKTNCSDPGRP
jgi:hypothetical protein